jgi:magnesium-transporting ATPase (P-type)
MVFGLRSVQVLKRWDFDHKLQLMSVAVSAPLLQLLLLLLLLLPILLLLMSIIATRIHLTPRLCSQVCVADAMYIFCKGSCERMRSCLATGSVPVDYDESCASLARNGSYVLALACRQLPSATSNGEVEGWERAAAECELKLLGFMTFDNFVKVMGGECCGGFRFWFICDFNRALQEDSPAVFAALRLGGIEAVMITGDSPHTAVPPLSRPSIAVTHTAVVHRNACLVRASS